MSDNFNDLKAHAASLENSRTRAAILMTISWDGSFQMFSSGNTLDQIALVGVGQANMQNQVLSFPRKQTTEKIGSDS